MQERQPFVIKRQGRFYPRMPVNSYLFVVGAAGGEEGGHDVSGGEGGQEDCALPGAGNLPLLPVREQGAGAGGNHEVTL